MLYNTMNFIYRVNINIVHVFKYLFFKLCILIFYYIVIFLGEKADLYDKTNPDWAPSLKMRPVEKETSANFSVMNRYERSKQRDERKIQLQTAEALLTLQTSVTNPDIDESFRGVNECGEKVQFFLKGILEPAGKTAEDQLLILEKMRSELQ